MPIKGLSDTFRLPRAGIIRLGTRVKTSKPCPADCKKDKKCRLCLGTGFFMRPKEEEFFVCPDIVKETYGEQPKELVIMFPVENDLIFFPQWYKMYGNDILLCRGDGIEGTYWDFVKADFVKRKCPCPNLENKKCKGVGVLQFLLPEIKEAVGVWQITTGSTNSIKDINGGIKMVQGIADRVAMIPLILKRVPTKTSKLEKDKIIKGLHFTMQLSLGMSLLELQRMALLPPSRALLPQANESFEAVDDIYVNELEPNGKNGVMKDEPNPEPKESKAPEPEKEVKTDEPFALKQENEDEEKEVIEKIVEKDINESELAELKKELSAIMEEIDKAGRKLTDAEAVKLDALQTVEGYRNKITYWKRELEKSKATTDLFNKNQK